MLASVGVAFLFAPPPACAEITSYGPRRNCQEAVVARSYLYTGPSPDTKSQGAPSKKSLLWGCLASPTKRCCGSASYLRICTRTGVAKDQYKNCGRKAVLTKSLRKWLVRRLLVLRKSQECTSTISQSAKHQNVTLETSTIRKALAREGYFWLVRSKKPKYSKEQRADRL